MVKFDLDGGGRRMPAGHRRRHRIRLTTLDITNVGAALGPCSAQGAVPDFIIGIEVVRVIAELAARVLLRVWLRRMTVMMGTVRTAERGDHTAARNGSRWVAWRAATHAG